MPKYAALIRGIGPGDPHKSNASLCGVLDGLGLQNVRPVISSGNVIFESNKKAAELEASIENAWPEKLGFRATTIVRSQQELQELINAKVFKDDHGKGSYQLITFFKMPTKPGFALPHKLPNQPIELVGYIGNALFSQTDTTALKTPDFMTWLEKQYGKQITSRTPLTIQRILAKMDVA